MSCGTGEIMSNILKCCNLNLECFALAPLPSSNMPLYIMKSKIRLSKITVLLAWNLSYIQGIKIKAAIKQCDCGSVLSNEQ
jgi:hypothetical protein